MARRRRSKKTSWAWLAFFPLLTLLVLLSKCGNNSSKHNTTPTSQNVETMVMLLMSQTPTATIMPTATETPTPTETPLPTAMVEDSVCHDISCGCKIWGNVNQNKETKIYHCPNDPNYYPQNFKASQGDRWFCTEEEAIAEGFRQPKNAPACGGF